MNKSTDYFGPICLIMTTILITMLLGTSITASEDVNNDFEGWKKWRTEYDLTLTKKSGWLSLVGLHWLSEGKNTIGSAEDNDHVFPINAPTHLGYVEVKGEMVSFVDRNNVRHRLSVLEGTVVSFGDFEFYMLKREKGFAIRLIENNAEKIKSFGGTRYLPFNTDWVLSAKLVLNKEPKTLRIPTVYGTIREEKSAGWITFEIDGKVQRIEAVDYGKKMPMYLMFSDKTSGKTTYGAGRYIEVEWPDENGNTVIDFNRAYNPPCAYTSFATCPLTPKQNRLKIAIDAGELDVSHEDY